MKIKWCGQWNVLISKYKKKQSKKLTMQKSFYLKVEMGFDQIEFY